MKRSLLRSIVLVGLLTAGLVSITREATSQIFVQVAGGSGGTRAWMPSGSNPNSFQDYWWTIRSQYLFKASELTFHGMAPGQITSMAFNIRTTSVFPARLTTIYIKSVTPGTPLTNPMATTGMTMVYNNPAFQLPLLTNTPTWVKFDFSSPFMWDGVSDLMIEYCWSRTAYTYVFPEYEYCTVSPAYACQNFFYSDGQNYCLTSVTGTGYSSRPVVQFGVLSGIETSFPDDVDPRRILRQGQIYDGVDPNYPKPSLSFRQTAGQNINLTYKIVGPLPLTNVIYEARKSGNPTMNHIAGSSGLFNYEMTEATGPAAGVNGTLDLRFTPGGSYRVDATYQIPGYTQTWSKEFSIAFANDLMVRQIRSPLSAPKKYPRGVAIPISARIQNVGLNNVTDARVIATVRHQPTNAEVFVDTFDFTGNLATGDLATIDFENFTTMTVATYSITICSELLSAVDQQTVNDCQPMVGSYTFETRYNEEVGASAIEAPTSTNTYYSRRPFTPRGRIINGGIQDLSNIPVRLQIFQNPGRIPVYNQVVIVPDVGAEFPLNVASFDFPPFTPQVAGQYEACLTTEYPGDPVANNNQICQTFTVQPSLAGTYTIGTTKLGDPRNYPTIQDAVDDLYRRGVAGAVEYELTDAAYSVGSGSGSSPALDLTSKIIGVDATNTITFKPSLARSINKGSIVVTLNSGNGVGILFGQNALTSNPNAVQMPFQKDPQWANSDGFIRFDGGAQKSLVFELNATTPFRAPFYLGDGSRDIAVRNSIIRNAASATPSYASSLPSINFVNNTFSYQADVRTGPITYSAGIVSRQKLPLGRDGNNSERLDTIPGSNNAFVNNEISGFGYGIVSMGIGMAIKSNVYQGFYTKGSQISGNMITNVRTAGIFVGYDDGGVISGNRIYNVGVQATGGTNVDAAGIVAGGVNRYNNTNLKIRGNEISAWWATCGRAVSVLSRYATRSHRSRPAATRTSRTFRKPRRSPTMRSGEFAANRRRRTCRRSICSRSAAQRSRGGIRSSRRL
ncbi:MAG: hypothetical protein IPM83_09505 [Ignavibacteria bacterium]|nr:hypothetical protein [Ignavibacteria bacterium]